MSSTTAHDDGATEAALVRRAAEGDRAAMTRLTMRLAPHLRQALAGTIAARWRSLVTVDDVIQDTWVAVLRSLPTFRDRGPGSFRAWVVAIALHELRRTTRRLLAAKRGGDRSRVDARRDGADTGDWVYVELLASLAAPQERPSQVASAAEARRLLERAMARLSPAQRTLIQLYDIEGRDAARVGRELACSPAAVYMLHRRTLDRLGAVLGWGR